MDNQKKELQRNSSKTYLESTIQRSKEGNTISTYTGELTNEGLARAVSDIKDAFPDLDKGFYKQLMKQIKLHNFVDDRLAHSVDYVISSCRYPKPTVAQFISYDKTMDLFTYDQLLEKSNTDRNVFEKYKPIQFASERNLMWVAKNDSERLKLGE